MDKCDRALKLKEQGLENSQIAERLGSNSKSISGMIAAARERRRILTTKEEQQKENGKF